MATRAPIAAASGVAGIAVFGITGRMGQSLVRALREAAAAASGPVEGVATVNVAATAAGANQICALYLSGAIASSSSSRLDNDAAIEGAATGVTVTADAALGLQGAAVAVDFSRAHSVGGNVRACVQAGVPLVVGTTGLDAATWADLQEASKWIPVLVAANTSVGVAVVTRLVELATRALGADYDVEVSEAHHRMKRDAPSGTALALGEAVAGARGQRLAEVAVFDRHGRLEPRVAGEIGFAVVRAGDIVGEHTVSFAVAGERVELTHRATDRITFARGALRAAEWLAGRPPGLYRMTDVLGLDLA